MVSTRSIASAINTKTSRTTTPESYAITVSQREMATPGRSDDVEGVMHQLTLLVDFNGNLVTTRYVPVVAGVAQAVAHLIEWDAMKCKAADNSRDTEQDNVRVHRDFADASVEARFPIVSITFPLEDNSMADFRFVPCGFIGCCFAWPS